MVTRSEPGYAWDFCGGHPAIDFINTVGSRGGTRQEHFTVYADVLSWAQTRGVITRAEAHRLEAAARKAPGAARDALKAIVAIRESLYRVIAAVASGRRPPSGDLNALNARAGLAFEHARLQPAGARLALVFHAPPGSLTQPILAPVLRAAVALVTSDAVARVRVCADRSCGWLFIDATRSGTRRWCDMKVCGNRNKVRTFRAART
jgi:predicted RNA-binding Zn ribbon-like protein